jgi:hexosaminidase
VTQDASRSIPLLPPPRELELGAPQDAFWLDADVSIVLSARATDETVATARLLQTAIQVATGLLLPIRRTLRPLEESRSIVLLRADRDGPVPSTDLASMGPEGYALSIGQQRLLVLATAERGLFYGVQTLRQLLRTQGRLLPALSIRDWPVLPNRGVMLDVSRGKVPTLETLFRLVENLAAYKYNHVQLYIEHPFHFPSHPEIGAGSDPLTADDILALDAHCRAHHVELVPNLQSFGHLRRLLSLPRYAHLDEVGWQWSLTPAREETYQLLDELYADFLPNFTSSWLNVDCDETWDLGTGQSRALAERLGKGRLYLQHILRVRDLAAKYGRRIMVWADILLHFPDLVAELPDDIVLLDWWYEAQDHYPSAALLGSLGRTFWVCPGTSSWNTLFPRIENAIGNIRTFVRDGLAAGASGMLLTDWGDYGHYQLLSLSWYPYLFGAAVAWSGPDIELDHFDRAFALLFLDRPADDASVRAIHRLGRAVTLPSLGLPNRSNSALALFDEPLAGRLIERTDPHDLEELAEAARAALRAWVALPDAQLRHDYTFTARLVVFAAEKLLASQRVRRLLGSLPDPADENGRSRGLTQLDEAIATLEAQRTLLEPLAREFEQRWLAHARRSEIHQTLDRFTALGQRYQAAIAWLREQRQRYASGQPVDATLATYSPGPYHPLWEEGVQKLLELVRLAGPDSLPAQLRESLEREGLLGGAG